MKRIIGILAFSILAIGFTATDAMALAEFKKAFAEKYAKKHESKDFQTAVKKASCNACHVKGEKKYSKDDEGNKTAILNEYGKMLDKLVQDPAKRKTAAKAAGPDAVSKTKAEILKEFEMAMEKVAKEKSEGGKGPEFGKIIESGSLPVTVEKAVEAYKAAKKAAAK